jgi:hypothetical protein
LDGSDLAGKGEGVPAVHNFQYRLQVPEIEQHRFSGRFNSYPLCLSPKRIAPAIPMENSNEQTESNYEKNIFFFPDHPACGSPAPCGAG